MADVLMTELADYLADITKRRFAFGELDCCIFMADWLVRRGLPDPMRDRRGGYGSRADYRALMRTESGILASCRQRFAAIGLREQASAPRPGDVCLVRAPARQTARRTLWTATGAIAVTDRWRAVVTPDAGLVCAELAVVCSWGECNG